MYFAEPEYADELLEHSKQMLEFGLEHPGTYMKSKQEGLIDHGKHYPSSNFNDELSWGAIWLYFATGVSLKAIDTVCTSSPQEASHSVLRSSVLLDCHAY